MTKPKTPATQAQKDAALANAQQLLAVKTLNSTASAGAWPKPKEPRIHNGTSTKPYAALELRPFAGRPGSLDFLRCPSRTAGGLVHRGEVMA